MNCYTESFFQNCSLIAPSRLSGCLLIYCSIAPPMIDSFSHSTIDFSVLSFFNHKYEEIPHEPSCLNHCSKSCFFRVSLPACGRQTGVFSSASSWEHQHGSSHRNCGDQAPAARELQRNCKTPHHSQNL